MTVCRRVLLGFWVAILGLASGVAQATVILDNSPWRFDLLSAQAGSQGSRISVLETTVIGITNNYGFSLATSNLWVGGSFVTSRVALSRGTIQAGHVTSAEVSQAWIYDSAGARQYVWAAGADTDHPILLAITNHAYVALQSVAAAAPQSGTNSMIIDNSVSAQQVLHVQRGSHWVHLIDSDGAVQYGYLGQVSSALGHTLTISNANGAMQLVAIADNVTNAAVINNRGTASLQLASPTNNQTALMTGTNSIGLGAVNVTNNSALVMGSGNVSHGDGSLTADSAFVGGAPVANSNQVLGMISVLSNTIPGLRLSPVYIKDVTNDVPITSSQWLFTNSATVFRTTVRSIGPATGWVQIIRRDELAGLTDYAIVLTNIPFGSAVSTADTTTYPVTNGQWLGAVASGIDPASYNATNQLCVGFSARIP